jgi:putative endonuclease
MPWFVYIVECADATYYTGIAVDVSKRIAKHNAGKGAAYTRARGPVALLYSEEHPDRSSASKREWALKRLTRAQKGELIKTNHEAVYYSL